MIGLIVNIIKFMLRVIHPIRLAGPVLDKELRVSSSRKRTYALRTLYLVLLIFVVALFWMEELNISRTSSVFYQASRMSMVGLMITTIVIWFQFVAAQLVIGISLSNAISDEVYHKTLGTLMTTPITGFQIVFGKLFSKLFIVFQLVAITFPMLGIIRVFGGIPWMYVLSSLYLTITTAILVGTISLMWSIFCRRAYLSIISIVLTIVMACGLSVIVFVILAEIFHWNNGPNVQALYGFFLLTNPYATFFVNMITFIEPSGTGGIVVHWFFNGLVMLAVSLVMLIAASVFVRRAALAQIAGTRSTRVSKKKTFKIVPDSRPLRTVTMPPVLWKELKTPMLSRHRSVVVLILAGFGILLSSYLLLAAPPFRLLDDADIHDIYISVFMGLGVLFTLIIPATVISSEKESRSWEILLATPLTSRQIVRGKYLGSIRRCVPAWGLLFLHLIIFVWLGVIHPLALVQMPMIFLGITAFLAATGLYFSHRFKHTTTAVIWNISFAAAIWIILPFIFGMISSILNWNSIEKLVEYYMDTNPFVQAIVVVEGNMKGWDFFLWVGLHISDSTGLLSTVWIFLVMLGNLLAAWFLVRLTSWRLRKHID